MTNPSRNEGPVIANPWPNPQVLDFLKTYSYMEQDGDKHRARKSTEACVNSGSNNQYSNYPVRGFVLMRLFVFKQAHCLSATTYQFFEQ